MSVAPPAVVQVLAEDRQLAALLAPEEHAAASQHLIAAEMRLGEGPWEPEGPLGAAAGDFGYLVLDGLLSRDVRVGRHGCAELLGPGEVLRPWDVDEGAAAPVRHESAWRVLQPARLAVLDARFAAIAGRFPPLVAELLSRTLRRSRDLAFLLAIAAMPRLDARLLAALWHLADRWGRVGPEGTVVPLRLTHETLAGLVGAQRPSVTTALRSLERRGALRRDAGGGWLLLGDPPGDAEAAVGEGRRFGRA
ncbi:MAG TPA: helix-turn-helix domain-containing protein [Solirubrobacteraceae bacterium]|nr:helix-turn-helix domain-containing protein [Solirubrobacteraceae bacterium]